MAKNLSQTPLGCTAAEFSAGLTLQGQEWVIKNEDKDPVPS